jgi:hypothetical protein
MATAILLDPNFVTWTVPCYYDAGLSHALNMRPRPSPFPVRKAATPPKLEGRSPGQRESLVRVRIAGCREPVYRTARQSLAVDGPLTCGFRGSHFLRAAKSA